MWLYYPIPVFVIRELNASFQISFQAVKLYINVSGIVIRFLIWEFFVFVFFLTDDQRRYCNSNGQSKSLVENTHR
jgi:hypothetical protein